MGTFAVIGNTGQLSKALQRQGPLGGHTIISYSREDLELSDSPTLIDSFIGELPNSIDAVIIAAAYTGVDQAESEYELAYTTNAKAPTIIAAACKKRNLPLIYISTDYVFDGNSSKPYQTTDITTPINAYGRSKFSGEEGIVSSGCRCAILRTSWVFDGTSSNFMTTMLRHAITKSELRVVDDQIGRPTYAGHLADAVLVVAQKLCGSDLNGEIIYHVSGSGLATSWAGFAMEIFKICEPALTHKITVIPVPSYEYPAVAKRPSYSVMDTSRFEFAFAQKLPNWKEGIHAAFLEYGSQIREDNYG